MSRLPMHMPQTAQLGPSALSRLLAAVIAGAALTSAMATSAPAAAETLRSEPAPSRLIFVPVDKSASFRLDQPASKIVVAQSDTAEVIATSDQSFYVRGVAVGSTNLLVYGPGGRLQQVIDVRVGYDAQALQSDMAAAFPSEAIRVRNVGEGLMLVGEVSNASIAKRAEAMAQKFAPNAASSNLTVRASQEVVLEVRVLEASRSALQDLGFSGVIGYGTTGLLFGSSTQVNPTPGTVLPSLIGAAPANGILSFKSSAGNVSIDANLQALEQKGIVRTLARPNLVALSGEKASFLAGGEFPYPVPQGLNQITLEFRQYGVKLDFQPVVQDDGLIRLKVAPEVSQLDTTNSVRINGVTVPGLTTRKADTTVELKNGDSLAIGGLLQHNYTNAVRQIPLIGDLPIVGTLFRSARWQRDETELVIIVTPRLATAETFAKAAATQGIGGPEPFAADLFLNGRALDKRETRDRGASRTPRSNAPE